MRLLLAFSALSLMIGTASASVQAPNRSVDDIIQAKSHYDVVIIEEVKTPKDYVYTSAEVMPQFPGGEAGLLDWVNNHVIYPKACMEMGIQGRVVLRFVVKSDGSIGDVQIVRGKDPNLDKEAVRVVKSLPGFTPGMMNGEPVNVWYTLPVTFRLAH